MREEQYAVVRVQITPRFLMISRYISAHSNTASFRGVAWVHHSSVTSDDGHFGGSAFGLL